LCPNDHTWPPNCLILTEFPAKRSKELSASTAESFGDKGLKENALIIQFILEKPQHIVHCDHRTPRYGVFTKSAKFD
jgi:hypothetical protein